MLYVVNLFCMPFWHTFQIINISTISSSGSRAFYKFVKVHRQDVLEILEVRMLA